MSIARVALGVVVALATILTVARLREGGSVAPMKTTGTVISDDGTTIAFTKLGQGPPIIMVDGALCFRDNGPSRDLAPLLASHFTVYAYDRRGRGESGDARPYTIAREIEDLKAVIRAAGAVPDARALLLPDQNHDVSAAGKALTPVITDFVARDR